MKRIEKKDREKERISIRKRSLTLTLEGEED
jgi:hypothetical protein